MSQLPKDIPTASGCMPILLVDDQAMVGHAVRQLLADAPDLQLHYCPDACAAIATAVRLGPFVILQDLVMPDVDGLDLLRDYRANALTAATPVIILSADDNVETKSRAFGAGADDYLVKLPDKIELVARLRRHARAFLDRKQRDAAFQALRDSEARLLESNQAITQMNERLEQANRRISELARIDPLTGLVNRRVFSDELAHWALHSERKAVQISALILDLDHFKSVNDDFGHAVGDAALVAVAGLLQQKLRPLDIAARYGGEEFVLLLPQTDLSEALLVAERLREEMPALNIEGYPRKLTTSIGVAQLQIGEPVEAMLKRADAALYRAKHAGRNRVES